MKKGRNRTVRRYTLPKSKILRGRKNFNRLFSDKATVFKGPKVSLRFCINEDNDNPVSKMAFIVPKRLGKAVSRNRMKRFLKEAYRLNQFTIADEVNAVNFIFHGALIAKTVDAEYEEIKLNVLDLLNRAKNYIKNLKA